MNEHKEHIKQYSAADIQRYVQGHMTAQEMHAIEKAALDDPFLADAIEGMQLAFAEHDEQSIIGPLQELQQQVSARVQESKRKTGIIASFHWWQVAAAAVVIIIAGVWIYTLVDNKDLDKSNQAVVVAKTEEVKPDANAPQTIPAPPQQKANEVNADSALVETSGALAKNETRVPTFKSKKQLVVPYTSAPASAVASEAAAPVPAAERKADSIPALAYQSNDDVRKKEESAWASADRVAPVASAKPADLLAKKAPGMNIRTRETELITIGKGDTTKKRAQFDNKTSGIVEGRVTDQYNNPIAYADLQLPNNRNNFTTDKAGFFKIPTYDSIVDVAVNASGYGTQNFRLKNNESNQLQMQPQPSAFNYNKDEALKTATAYKKAYNNNAGIVSPGQPTFSSAIAQDAEPVNGWIAYNQYLDKNKKTPDHTRLVTGSVVVSFDVNKKGTLSNFTIEQSLSKPYDDEVIQLVKQGPSWRLLKGHKARATVVVKF